MICLYCKKEFNSERITAKFCSAKCRIYFNRISVTNNPVISVTNDSVTEKVNVSEVSVTNVITPAKEAPIKTGIGTGICHGCQRKFVDIISQWVDEKVNEEDAQLLCVCLDCVRKGITHQSLGLDVKECEIWAI